MLILHKADIIIISLNVTCSGHPIAAKIAHLALNNNNYNLIFYELGKITVHMYAECSGAKLEITLILITECILIYLFCSVRKQQVPRGKHINYYNSTSKLQKQIAIRKSQNQMAMMKPHN